MSLEKLRNIGISAHIDSGKTTLSERILYYSGRIHKIEEVRGGGDGATMDYMDLEREKGITITSAATSVHWGDYGINLIDTPGHVDFTVEVERSLRVLDGAILVLCAVSGVQAQSLTIDRQMKRYGVPRLAFINKMDRTGANPQKVMKQLKDKLGCDAVAMQISIGKEHLLEGVIDLIEMKAMYFDGEKGENVRAAEIPAAYVEEATLARQTMLEALSMYSDELMELLLAEEPVPVELIHKVVRQATLQRSLTPVFLGSAYKNKGVQLLLDAICRYLPSPLESPIKATSIATGEKVELAPEAKKPFVGMAFKIVQDSFGSLTFMRIYQGTIKKGESYFNQRTDRKERFSRIVRMHADKREDIETAGPGDIVAVLGVDCASGDTYCADSKFVSLESIFVPEPVIAMAIRPTDRAGSDKLSKALQRFRREDPTFQVSTDEETSETIIAGMGELHLEIYVERIKREYGVDVQVDQPQVNYRESPGRKAEYNYKHKKQTGGSGQYAHIVGYIEPLPEDSTENFVFEDKVVGGRIPKNFIPAVEKGFRQICAKGPLAGFPVVKINTVLEDGSYHDVDSSEMAFQICARATMRETFLKSKPVLLEPIMKIEIEIPSQFQGPVIGDLTSRRGMITQTDVQGDTTTIEGEVPLSMTFGYSTTLRGMTQGQGTFTLEFKKYRPAPNSVQEEVVASRKAGLVGVAD